MSFLNLFKSKIDRCLGIDFGTSVLKIVELKKEKERLKLENYGLALPSQKEQEVRTIDLSVHELSKLIKQVLIEAKIKTKKAIISLPIFSSFSILVSLPQMSEKELASAIPFEVKKYIPVPVDEVILDWSIIGKVPSSSSLESAGKKGIASPPGKSQGGSEKIQALVVAVPKEIINKYVQVARMANLDLLGLEQEAFSLARSLIGNDLGLYLIVDIGSRGSSVIVIDEGFVKLSHTLEKTDKQLICEEIIRVVDIYKEWYNKGIKNCILVGGVQKSDLTDFLPGCLIEMETIIGNPFARIEYLSKLEPAIKDIKPLLAVAAGLAMREL